MFLNSVCCIPSSCYNFWSVRTDYWSGEYIVGVTRTYIGGYLPCMCGAQGSCVKKNHSFGPKLPFKSCTVPRVKQPSGGCVFVYDLHETSACRLPKASQHQSRQLQYNFQDRNGDPDLCGIPRTMFARRGLAGRKRGDFCIAIPLEMRDSTFDRDAHTSSQFPFPPVGHSVLINLNKHVRVFSGRPIKKPSSTTTAMWRRE
jgi:hypothetical protein